MCLGQVLGIGPDLFPEESEGVKPHHIDPLVGQGHQVAEHLQKDLGVPVIEVPLVAVEDGHHPAPHFRDIGKVARGRLGEDLGQVLLKCIRDAAVGVGVVVRLVFRVALPGLHRPGEFV